MADNLSGIERQAIMEKLGTMVDQWLGAVKENFDNTEDALLDFGAFLTATMDPDLDGDDDDNGDEEPA